MNAYEPFSDREKEVLDLLIQGKSNKQIAMQLGVSNRTIEFHLSNIYSKLGVSSRAEAILILMKDTSSKSEAVVKDNPLREPAVLPVNKSAYNEKKSKSPQRIPMKKRSSFIAGLGLLLIVLVMTFILLKNPDHSSDISQETHVTNTPTTVSISTPSPDKQIQTSVNANTFTQTIDSSVVSLTVKWFYIDQNRIYLDLVVSGFPLLQDFSPVRIIDTQKINIYRADGSAVNLDLDKTNFGGGGGGGGEGNATTEEDHFFNETLDVPLSDTLQENSQEETYLLDIPVGEKSPVKMEKFAPFRW